MEHLPSGKARSMEEVRALSDSHSMRDKPAFPDILLPRRSTDMRESGFLPPGKKEPHKRFQQKWRGEEQGERSIPLGCGGTGMCPGFI